MSLRNQKESYYCEECGVELSHRGRLCSDCNRELRNTYKKPKRNEDDTFKSNSGKSGKHSKNNGIR